MTISFFRRQSTFGEFRCGFGEGAASGRATLWPWVKNIGYKSPNMGFGHGFGSSLWEPDICLEDDEDFEKIGHGMRYGCGYAMGYGGDEMGRKGGGTSSGGWYGGTFFRTHGCGKHKDFLGEPGRNKDDLVMKKAKHV